MTRVALVAALALAWSDALAQGYPSKPITFVIPFAAGGDWTSRAATSASTHRSTSTTSQSCR